MSVLAIAVLVSAAVAAGLILLLRPFLLRHFLVRPNARSSHRAATAQGGGLAVIAATVLVGGTFVLAGAAPGRLAEAGVVVLAATLVATVGLRDDLRPGPVLPRLALQTVAVAFAVLVAGNGTSVLGGLLPRWLELGLLVLVGVWYVNLVNFMDGLDWMTVANFVPMLLALSVFAALSGEPVPAVFAAALLGALLGFAPFNKPVATLFLGDVGSLPIGLITGWLLYRLALDGALAATVLLPLYYLADATLTLLRRLTRGERVWQAHRSHFYQKATDHGFSVLAVAAHVALLNTVLVGLAVLTLVWTHWAAQVVAVALGAVLVALVLWRFARPHRLAGAAA